VYERRAIWDKKRVKVHSNIIYIEKCWKDINLEMKIEGSLVAFGLLFVYSFIYGIVSNINNIIILLLLL
jgi:hypothetical protein